MCGIAGVSLGDPCESATPYLIEAALLLQHRGQDACGLAVRGRLGNTSVRKGVGLVTEVLNQKGESATPLPGNVGLTHVRYTTNGDHTETQIQPLTDARSGGTTIVHNGNITNVSHLVAYLTSMGVLPKATTADSQLMLELFASRQVDQSERGAFGQISRVRAGVEEICRHCDGSFACILMIPGFGLVAFRDPHGIKPLVVGEKKSAKGGKDVMVASETRALHKLGFSSVRDIRPGEAIFCPTESASIRRYWTQQIVPVRSYTPDIFEFAYFARPDSVIDGISVNKSRQQMGIKLADTLVEQLGPEGTKDLEHIDCVIPIPETSYTSALVVSQYLHKPFAFGFVQNKYIHRSFIAPNHAQRLKKVQRKFTTVREEFEGRNVLIVDDSIVRGTTSLEIVKMAREAGARKVHFASSSPPIRFKHIHGIDLAEERQLVAHERSHEEIRKRIGCDTLVYLPLDRLVEACLLSGSETPVTSFEVGLFSGSYVTVPGVLSVNERLDMPVEVRQSW